MAVIYGVLVLVGQRFMAKRQPFQLKGPLTAWNLFLAIFSAFGALRTVPHLCLLLYRHGVVATFCAPMIYLYGNGACGFWVMLFIYSKLKFFYIFVSLALFVGSMILLEGCDFSVKCISWMIFNCAVLRAHRHCFPRITQKRGTPTHRFLSFINTFTSLTCSVSSCMKSV
jgi:hypothetical protein